MYLHQKPVTQKMASFGNAVRLYINFFYLYSLMRPDLRTYKVERRVLEENEGDYRRGKKKEGERVKLAVLHGSLTN